MSSRMSTEEIACKVAAKARNGWIKKAAGFRVAAQEAASTGVVRVGQSALDHGQGSPEVAAHVAELNARADEAERLAGEWAAKAETPQEAKIAALRAQGVTVRDYRH